jgi:HK97 family phage portal protein
MSLFGLFQTRESLEDPATPLTSSGLLSWLVGPPTDSGIHVDSYTSMKMAAFYRGTTLLANLGGALPIKVYKAGTKQAATNQLINSPHPDMTALEFWRLSYLHRILFGNFYAQKIMTSGSGRVAALEPLDPMRVKVGRVNPTTANPAGKIFEFTDDEGRQHALTSSEVFHIPGLGYDGYCGTSVVRFASQAIGMALAAEKYGARLFGSGNLMSGLLQTDQTLTKDQAETLQERWERMNQGIHKSHRTAILDAGAKFQTLTMPNDDAQLLESRDFQVTEIARFLGIPPYLMFQTEKQTSWGTGLEQQARGFTQFDLHPAWLGPTEQRVTKELLKSSQEARYDMNMLMRGDSIARAEYYRVMREAGVLNPNEIREQEDLPPRDGGDVYLDPVPGISQNDPMGTDKVLGGGSMGPPDSG